MTRNEVIDWATRVAVKDGNDYATARASLEDYLLGKLDITECIALRDYCGVIPTLGARLIHDIMWSWHNA